MSSPPLPGANTPLRPLLSVLGLVYGLFVLLFAVLAALVVGTVMALPFAPIARGRRESFTVWAAVVWSRVVLHGLLGARPRVTGKGNLPSDRGALVVANHRSWLDPLLLIAELRAVGLSKSEIFWLPAIGQYAWLCGAVFVNRRSRAGRQRAREEVMMLIRGGARIGLFPEGTRSRDGELRDKVYLTLPKDCWEEGVAVLPCAVYGTERSLPTTWSVAIPFQRCRMDIGEVVDPQDYATAEAFADAVWGDVRTRFEALRAEEERG
ncbi:MAG: 1-acyl-sn-glycerol-3-phosphate acyltransferase [Deltaproteobacteria bacterium]|nr:MAG: 1-acyl-sn-glycerol-3-phosphate acyltransferase [Deltaproteobacteria bacterium]